MTTCACSHPLHWQPRPGLYRVGVLCQWCDTCKGRHNPRRCPDKPCNCTEYNPPPELVREALRKAEK